MYGRLCQLAAALMVLAVLGVCTGFPTDVAAAQGDPAVAPVASLSADGRTVTSGTRTLTASQVADLDPRGQAVAVAGSGYDSTKGIYVALCVIPPRNAIPSPCGGGVDREGSADASQWFSSNPPEYGVGLARPYGPGGSFSTNFNVQAEIAPGIDCRQVRCALVTRSDHTRTSDRSQDLMIPVRFRDDAGGVVPTAPSGSTPGETPGEPSTTAPPIVEVPDTAAPESPPSTAPPVSLSDDGTEGTDGTRILKISEVSDLDPEEATVSVAGEGYDDSVGIYVALCAVGDDPTVAPGPCTAGGGTSAWISSDPPEHGAELATPFDEGGSFEVDLTIGAAIDAETDCRNQACAIVTRFDDQRLDDRTGDLAVPVSFADRSMSSTTTAPEAVEEDEGEAAAATEPAEPADGGTSALPAIVGGGLVVLLAVGAVALRSRRGAGSTTEPLVP